MDQGNERRQLAIECMAMITPDAVGKPHGNLGVPIRCDDGLTVLVDPPSPHPTSIAVGILGKINEEILCCLFRHTEPYP